MTFVKVIVIRVDHLPIKCMYMLKSINPGGPLSGRYVIVQMNNGDDVSLNLQEVRAFGRGKLGTFSKTT